MSLVAIALAAFVTQPATHGGHAAHAPAAPATAAGAARLTTGATTIGDLLANPAAKAIIDKHLPGLSSHPQLNMALRMTLRAAMPYSQGLITDARLSAIDTELAALPAS